MQRLRCSATCDACWVIPDPIPSPFKCGKRLKALIPTLIDSMTRHGHLSLPNDLRRRLKQISAATIDRLLRDAREQAFSGQLRRAGGIGNAIRRAVPIRTFTDWNDPLPGYLEVDFVEHCGGTKIDGDFVHSFVMTDIATGWTECLAMPFRSGAFVLEHIERVSTALSFPLRGLDCDNDSASMNAAVFDFCKATGIELTRSRAYKKNDQAWVSKKMAPSSVASWATAGYEVLRPQKRLPLFIKSHGCTSTSSSRHSN